MSLKHFYNNTQFQDYRGFAIMQMGLMLKSEAIASKMSISAQNAR